MSQSPYTSPTARVSDPSEAPQSVPTSVRRAIICLWLSVMLAVAVPGLQLLSAAKPIDAVAAVVTIAISAGLIALVATKIRARRGWARWLYLTLFVLGSLFFSTSVALAPETFRSLPLLHQALAFVQFVLQTAALIFMFTPAAWQWFSESHGATENNAL